MATTPAGGGAAPTPHVHVEPPQVHQVSFIAYPKLLFIWPLILAGYVLWPFAPTAAEHSPQLETVAWIYILILTIVIVTLGVDINRNLAIFWAVLVFAVWIGGKYLADVKGITVLGDIYKWFDSLDIQYNRQLGFALSVVLSVPFAIMLLYAWINDRWRITHNEFEHYSFGRMDDSLGRGAKTIRTEFPDVLELLLGMAGTLIVYNASGTQEMRRIPHVMFLPLIRKKLGKILERTAVTAATTSEEEEELHP